MGRGLSQRQKELLVLAYLYRQSFFPDDIGTCPEADAYLYMYHFHRVKHREVLTIGDYSQIHELEEPLHWRECGLVKPAFNEYEIKLIRKMHVSVLRSIRRLIERSYAYRVKNRHGTYKPGFLLTDVGLVEAERLFNADVVRIPSSG